MITGTAYLVSCVTGLLAPTRLNAISKFLIPLYFGEFFVVLWLALVGARPRAEAKDESNRDVAP